MKYFINNELNKSFFYSMQEKYKMRISKSIHNGKKIKTSEIEHIIVDMGNKYLISKELSAFIKSSKIELNLSEKGVPRALNIFYNVKDKTVLVDVSDVIYLNKTTGTLACRDLSKLRSYFNGALLLYTMHNKENNFANSTMLVKKSADLYSDLLSFVIEAIYKITAYDVKCMERMKICAKIFYLKTHYNFDTQKCKQFISDKGNELDRLILKYDSLNIYDFEKFIEVLRELLEYNINPKISDIFTRLITVYGEGCQFMIDVPFIFYQTIMNVDENVYAYSNNRAFVKVDNTNNIKVVSSELRGVINEAFRN